MSVTKEKSTNWKSALSHTSVLIIMIGIALFAYSIRNEGQELQQYGYIGIFLLNVIGSATIILPAPAWAFVIAAGGLQALSPFWIGVAAGVGATIGELTGYFAGLSGQGIIENRKNIKDFIK